MKKKEILIPVFVAVAVFLIVAIPTYSVMQEDRREMSYEGATPIDIEVDRYCYPYQPPNCMNADKSFGKHAPPAPRPPL